MSTMSTLPSEIPPEAKLDEIRLVLVGKTGAGKSTTGNTIVGDKVFKVNASGLSTDSECQYRKFIRFEKKILLIDTPGVFDTERSPEVIQEEIHEFLVLSAPGPHAIILVTSAAWRFTQEEIDCIRRLYDMFGKELSKHLFVVITRTEDWDEDGVTAKSFLGGLPPEAKAVLKEALDEDRVLPFQNTLYGKNGEHQVRQLLHMISRHIEANKGACYTNEHWQEAEREMQKRIRLLKEKQDEAEKEKMQEMERKAMARVEEEQRRQLEERKKQHQQEMEKLQKDLAEKMSLEKQNREINLTYDKEKLNRKADDAAVARPEPAHARKNPQPKYEPGTQVGNQLEVTDSAFHQRSSDGETQMLSAGKTEEFAQGGPCMINMEADHNIVSTKTRHSKAHPEGGSRRVDSTATSLGKTSGSSTSFQPNLENRQRATLETTTSSKTESADSRHVGDIEADRLKQTYPCSQESERLRIFLQHLEKKDAEHRREMEDLKQKFLREQNEIMIKLQSSMEETMRDLARKQCSLM